MFQSGIVKFQAKCPTWENLTALERHFATQCIPTPISWYAHQTIFFYYYFYPSSIHSFLD